MKSLFVALFALPFILFAGCQNADKSQLESQGGTASEVDDTLNELELPSAVVVKVLGGPAVADIIRLARDVEAYRLPAETFFNDKLAEYEIPAHKLTIPGPGADELKKVLLDESSYEIDSAKGCEPVYGVGVTFTHDSETVDVLFCFQCDILTIYHAGHSVGGEDFDSARDRLVQVMKQTFTDDNVIQSLE